MRKQDMMKEISEIRETLDNLVQERAVSPGSAESARDALHSMCREASEYGLTSADVIRSVLGPVFEVKRGCGCPRCQFRQGELDQVNHELTNAH